MTAPTNTNEDQRREPEGIPAGNGSYVFNLAQLDQIDAGPAYSLTKGSLVVGERSMWGLMRLPRGTGSRPHSHANEQWVYIIQGRLKIEVAGTTAELGPGYLAYFPPDVVHSAMAGDDEDVIFLTSKDRAQGVWGKPVDNSQYGAAYAPGFEQRLSHK
jgi:quercetin dioxygenase-like cupin family protein